MNELLKRTITGIIFCIVIICSIILNQYVFLSLFAIISLFALWEFYKLVETVQIKPQKISGSIFGTLFFLTNGFFAFNLLKSYVLLFFIPLPFCLFIIELFSKSEQPFINISYTFLGLIYIVLPFSLLIYISTINGIYEPTIVLGVFFILWAYDVFAYLIGGYAGKHPLFLRISPKKTWEGVFGGTIMSLLVAYILSFCFPILQLFDWLVIAIIISIFGTLGDLVESLFKRTLNIKDTGNILPCHGGIMDRFDSFIGSMPFVFIYLVLR